MTEVGTAQPGQDHCPVCGGDLLEGALMCCPRCDALDVSAPATGADVTPYALAVAEDRPGWWAMAEWVWFAGSGRMNHVAMMRRSPASARFALINMLILACGLGVFQATVYGWRRVTNSPALESTGSTQPAGNGWFHLAGADRPLPPAASAELPVDLWWNPAQAIIVTAGGLATSFVLMWLCLALIRMAMTRALEPHQRTDGRMGAAIDYATAWCIPIATASLVLALRPGAFLADVRYWSMFPTLRGIAYSGGILAGLGAVFWWFWLIRLGATAATKGRPMLLAFFTLAAPVFTGGALVGWWFGLEWMYGKLFVVFRMDF